MVHRTKFPETPSCAQSGNGHQTDLVMHQTRLPESTILGPGQFGDRTIPVWLYLLKRQVGSRSVRGPFSIARTRSVGGPCLPI